MLCMHNAIVMMMIILIEGAGIGRRGNEGCWDVSGSRKGKGKHSPTFFFTLL